MSIGYPVIITLIMYTISLELNYYILYNTYYYVISCVLTEVEFICET